MCPLALDTTPLPASRLYSPGVYAPVHATAWRRSAPPLVVWSSAPGRSSVQPAPQVFSPQERRQAAELKFAEQRVPGLRRAERRRVFAQEERPQELALAGAQRAFPWATSITTREPLPVAGHESVLRRWTPAGARCGFAQRLCAPLLLSPHTRRRERREKSRAADSTL